MLVWSKLIHPGLPYRCVITVRERNRDLYLVFDPLDCMYIHTYSRIVHIIIAIVLNGLGFSFNFSISRNRMDF
jgi:hypothetical protein